MPFIVLEGLDGAGKSTQIELLRKLLGARGVASQYLHFPRFDAPVYGDLVARFLRGELGSLGKVDPYLIALIFAGDRADAAKLINGWLDAGEWVIADRYIYSNIGYQCAKIDDWGEREELRRWIMELEYGHNKIPCPDISLFLDVPFSFTEHKLTNVRDGDDRSYLKGAQDIHEASLDFQSKVREIYLWVAENDSRLRVVDCSDASGAMGSQEDTFEKIVNLLSEYVEM